ncbi:NAD(P)H-dependent flavin oxidoreductase [Agromyces sp. MMS24-K17]|uniref:NAD(P)H-dependent flavin oxidoreductase n=1 Tax=Agromyces sp. MMS24-K17 TaxID=3372850 RepID=UPI003755322F
MTDATQPSDDPRPSDASKPSAAPRPSLATAWSRGLGLRSPIVCAPMGGVAGGRLAAAVSRAGALGTIGMGSAGSAAGLARQLGALEAAGGTHGAPFGIGVVEWGIRRDPAMFDVALGAGAALISVGFSEGRFDWVERVHAAGALAATQVYDAREAIEAADAGVDVVVARGSEGGGHGDPRLGTLPLLDAVLDAIGGRTTVLAAGGVGSPRTLAAVLAAGADGGWVGTAFLACPEAMTTDASRRTILAADGADTVNTRAADAALGLPWAARFPERVIRTAFVDEWSDRADELADGASDAAVDARAAFAAAVAADDQAVVPFDAGQGVGRITSARPAAEVVAELAEGASALLARYR